MASYEDAQDPVTISSKAQSGPENVRATEAEKPSRRSHGKSRVVTFVTFPSPRLDAYLSEFLMAIITDTYSVSVFCSGVPPVYFI